MKHIRLLGQSRPTRAAAWQDIVCEIASVINAVVAAFGGASPIAIYVDEKCAIPDPNPDDDTTA